MAGYALVILHIRENRQINFHSSIVREKIMKYRINSQFSYTAFTFAKTGVKLTMIK